MARTISDEQLRFSIIIDGNPAQKELFDLEKSTRQLNEANKALHLQKKQMEKAGKQETEEYKALTKTIRENNTAIKENKSRMAELQDQIGITGLTMAQLQSKATNLKFVLRNLVPGSEDYKRYNKELDAVNSRLAELKGKGDEAKFSLGKLADGFNRYAALGASIIGALTGVVLSIQKVIDFNGKMSDSITNVQKTTGMTKKEVDDLAKSFGMLKTRTGRIELLGIAEIGGRLGIAKEEIADFVRVMDKSAVALGDSFEGGPEVVAEKLGRIKGLYDELKGAGVEEVFESVGSALNDLGAAGTASEANVAEFVTRLGAMPQAFRPTIQEALGLGAAFEESGLKAEVAAGNYGKVISIASRDIDAFSKVMRRPKQELEALINTNPNEFFLQFAQSLKGLDATDLAQILDYLKLNDNEVKMVLGAASANVELFREKILLANDSMIDATSLTTEYDLKNNNLAATLERLKKRIVGWFTSDSVVAFLESAVNGFAKLIGAVEDNEGAMTGFRNTLVFTAKVLSIVAASMISYTAGAKLATLWSNNLGKATAFSNIVFKIQYGLLVVQETATKSLALAKALLSGNIMRVRAAYQALSVAMSMNPFGALLAVIGAVVAAFVMFRRESDEVIKRQKLMNGLHIEAEKAIIGEKNELERLRKIAQNENLEKSKRIEALSRLNELIPDHIGLLNLENIKTQEGVDILKRHTDELYKNARARAAKSKFDELAAQRLDVENTTSKDYESGMDGVMNSIFGETDAVKDRAEVRRKAIEMLRAQGKARINEFGNEVVPKEDLEELMSGMMANLGLDQKEAALAAIDSQMKALEAEIEGVETRAGKVEDTVNTGNEKGGAFVPDTKSEKEAEKKAKKAREDFLKAREQEKEDLKKYQQETNELERQAFDARLGLIEDNFDKEEIIEGENYRRKLADLKKQLVSEAEIMSLEAEIDKDVYTPKQKAILAHTKETLLEKNKHINELIELEEGRHELKLLAIAQDAETKRLGKLQQEYEVESDERQAAFNEELLALGSNESARAALQAEHDKEELDRQVEHLREVLQAKQDILADQNGEIDFDLLTEDQRSDLEEQVAELKRKISEVLLAKQSLQGKDGTDDVGAAFKSTFGDADVLGFSADQWGQAFDSLDTLSEKLQAATMVVGALRNMWEAYADYLAASENASVTNYERSLDRKKKKLKWQLDNGYINQIQYKRGIETMEADLEKKKADAEYRQAKRQRAMAIANIILSTSQAIMGIWAQFPKMDFGATAAIMSGVVGALGALQLATVMKTPLPAKGYEKGLYPIEREQDGKMFQAGYGGKTRTGMVNKPTFFLAGERGPEMVIDDKAYREMSPEVKDILWRELRRVKGYEQGYYNKDAMRYEVPAQSTSAPVQSVSQEYLLSVLQKNTEVLERIVNEGVVAYYNRDFRDLKKMKEDMDKVTASRDKAKY